MMRDSACDSTRTALQPEAVHLVESYLRLSGFFTFRNSCNSARHSRSCVDLIALRLPTSTGFVSAPDPELALSPDAIEILIAILDTGGSLVGTEIRDPASLECALVRLGCCQGDPQTMALTLVRSGRAVSFLHENRLRARIFVFGDTPEPSRYETITSDHMARFVRLHEPAQEHLDGPRVLASRMRAEAQDA